MTVNLVSNGHYSYFKNIRPRKYGGFSKAEYDSLKSATEQCASNYSDQMKLEEKLQREASNLNK